MTQRKVWSDNIKFTVLRYTDITIYCFTVWFMYYCIMKYTALTKTFDWWCEIYHSTPNEITLAVLFLSGALTKYILINCRDSTLSKPPQKTTKVKPKKISSSYLKRWFTFLYRYLINPPLSASILISIGAWAFLNGYDVIVDSFYPFMIAYSLGWTLPYLYADKEIDIYQSYQNSHNNPTFRIQEEKPLINKCDDTLNRGNTIDRISAILSARDASDARGIAIIGPFGIGKSSLINMSVNDALEKNERTLICRLDTWGTYESDEQIQKFIIDEIINSISKLTSVTHLIGIPSKYINSLKGAQSFWLDTLPILHNHASASSQLKKVGNTLSLIRYQMILIIEDFDRNSHANDILNGVAPLLDKLNHQSTIKLILSIGEQFNKPDIINRVCRYKEFLNYNHLDAHSEILTQIKKLSSFKKTLYKGEIEDFFIEDHSSHTQARNSLFSYITSQRDLHLILREVSFSWEHILAGQCDILDLLAITIIKHFEPNLIRAINEYNERDNESENKKDLMLHLKNYNLLNINSATIVFEYFFMRNRIIHNRLQACNSYKDYYLTMLVERKIKLKNYDKPEDHYFYNSFKIHSALGYIKEADSTKNIKHRYDTMLTIKNHAKSMYDLAALHGKGTTSLLTLILIHWDTKENSSKKYNSATFSDHLNKVDFFSIKNKTLALSLTTTISESLINRSLSDLLSFYKAINHSKNIDYIFKPSMEVIFAAAKMEYENSSHRYIIDVLLYLHQLFSILWSDSLSTLASMLNEGNGEFEREVHEVLLNYKSSQHSLDISEKINQIKELLISTKYGHMTD